MIHKVEDRKDTLFCFDSWVHGVCLRERYHRLFTVERYHS